MKRDKSNYMIQSVCHALDLLEEMCKAGGEIGVTELSKRLKLHKNNVFRLLATLELRGYIEQNRENENYHMGVKVLEMGQCYIAQNSLIGRATPVIRGLADATGETVSLAVLQAGNVQYPISCEGKRPVKVAPRTGVSFPAKLNAAGRLLTAQLSEGVLAELLASDTVHDVAIKSQLGELRTNGCITDRAAIEADVVSHCRVVRGLNNEVVAAIEVLSPQYRAKLDALMPAVEEAASKLSTVLGGGKNALAAQIEKEGSPTSGGEGMVVVGAPTSTSTARVSR